MALVVFTGGARSGKSAAAQSLAEARERDGSAVTIAVFGVADGDPEFAERVAHHRASRPRTWTLHEASDPTGWVAAVSDSDVLVVDCLGTALGLLMMRHFEKVSEATLSEADASVLPDGFGDAVESAFSVVIEGLVSRPGDTIVVTNEVGCATVPGYASERLFRDVLGRANRMLTNAADAAYLCVAGRLIALDELPRTAHWPVD